MSWTCEARAAVLARHLGRVRSTSRIAIEGEYRGGIVALWHDSLYVALVAAPPDPDLAVYAWGDRRAQLMARVAELRGLHVVRGSARNRHGYRAVLEWLSSPRRTLVMAVDGPLGPPRVVKPGVVHFAARAGVPIVAGRVSVARCQRLESWDGRCLPDPHNEIRVELHARMATSGDRGEVCRVLQSAIGSDFRQPTVAASRSTALARWWAGTCAGQPMEYGRIVLGDVKVPRPPVRSVGS